MKESRGFFFLSPNRTAGEKVTHDSAMTNSAVWRAISLISETVAGLPWSVNTREITADGRKKTTPMLSNPIYRLLDTQPNPETDAFSFRQTMVAWALTWGNGYAEIERDGAGRALALWQIEPNRVTVERDGDGRLVYKVNNGTAPPSIIPARDMYHLKGMGFDGLIGYSVISYAARSIGMGLATEQFGADFFANGAHEGGVLQHPSRLGEAAIEHLKKSVQEATGGRNHHRPMVLEEGMTWNKTTIPPDDAQFLETRKFNITEIARWYGVPPHKLMEMESATFSNIEHQNIEFVTDAIMSWVKRCEIEANIKLISPAQGGRMFTKLNVNYLLRGDTAARSAWYKAMFDMGVYCPNDILELEDRNPIGPEGDKHLVQLNLTTLDKAGENNASNNPPAPALDGQTNPTPAGADAPNPAAHTILAETFGRIVARETRRITDALKKYDGDRDGLQAFINKFNDDHKKYMRKSLAAPVSAFGIDIDLDQYIDHYAENITNRVISTFDAGGAMFHVEPAELVSELLGAR